MCTYIPNAFENLLAHTSCGIECGEARHLLLIYCINERPDWSSASRGQRMGRVLLSGAPALAPLHTGGERSQPGWPAAVAGIFTRQRCAGAWDCGARRCVSAPASQVCGHRLLLAPPVDQLCGPPHLHRSTWSRARWDSAQQMSPFVRGFFIYEIDMCSSQRDVSWEEIFSELLKLILYRYYFLNVCSGYSWHYCCGI